MSRQYLRSEHYVYPAKALNGIPSVPADNQMSVIAASASNSSGSAIDVAILRKFASNNYEIYAAESGNADLNAIKDGTATSIIDNDNDDGFIIESPDLFNLIGLNITQADGGGATYAFEYWNGSAYAALTAQKEAASMSSTGNSLLLALSELSWVQNTSVSGSGAQVYSLRVSATTAGAAVVIADALYVGQILEYVEALADNARAELLFEQHPLLLAGGESIMPYFATANAANMASISYKYNE